MSEFPGILFITGQLGLGGAEKQLYLLIKGLISKYWRVSVITLNPGKGDYWEISLKELHIPIYGIPTNMSRIRRMFFISRILRNENPLLVHSWTIHANFYAAAAGYLARIPGKLGSERANQNSSLKSLGKMGYDLSLIGLDGLVTNSMVAAKFLKRYRPNLRTFVVRNGIEIHNQTLSKQECRRKLGVSEEGLYIGAVGSLSPRKNFSMLIKVAKQVINNYPSAKFVLIGGGPLLNQLKAEIIDESLQENFYVLGPIPRTDQLLHAFDIFCFPSHDQEGMPNVIIEAAASNLPVVATRVGSVDEIIDEGKNGFLVEENDYLGFSKRIEELLQNPSLQKKMGIYGRNKIRLNFSTNLMVEKMHDIYKSILMQKGIQCE